MKTSFKKSDIISFIVFIAINIQIFAQNYPTQETVLSTNWQNYEAPTNTPGYLETFVNEFGNEVTRISDADVFGTTGQNLRHHYSLDQPYNSDGSLIKLAGYPAAILDAETNEFLYWANIPSSATWSNTEPLIMYGTQQNQLIRFHVDTNQREVLKTFTEYTEIDYGYNKGNISNNDKYMPLMGETSTGILHLIVYDLELNQVHAVKQISPQPNWFGISPLGNYVLVHYSGHVAVMVYDIGLTESPRTITTYTTHSDIGVDAFGNEVYVAYGDVETRANDYYMKMVRLSDGVTTPLFYHPEGYGIWHGHISCRNINRQGWAYVSEGCCETVGFREIFAIKLDGSDTIERFGYHHSNDDLGYGHEAHAVPNRDGSKVVFASNWNELYNNPYPPAFIVEAPQTTLSVENVEAFNKLIKIYYYTILGQELTEDVLNSNQPNGYYIEKRVYENRVETKLIGQ